MTNVDWHCIRQSEYLPLYPIHRYIYTTGWPRSYRKYILQITQPSQYGYAKLQYRFAVTSGSSSTSSLSPLRIAMMKPKRIVCQPPSFSPMRKPIAKPYFIYLSLLCCGNCLYTLLQKSKRELFIVYVRVADPFGVDLEPNPEPTFGEKTGSGFDSVTC